MTILVNLIYGLLLTTFSPWILYRIVFQKKNRRGWGQKLFGLVPRRRSVQSGAKCIWFHAVSVGEINLLKTLLQRIKHEWPDVEVAISTTTETGFELAQKLYPDAHLFFCPSDFSWAIKNTLRRIKPDVLVLTELELWPNLIRITKRSGVSVSLLNGRISENSYRGYRRLGWVAGPILSQLDLVMVQNPLYADRMAELGVNRQTLHVTGNVKFDGVTTDRKNIATLDLKERAGISESDFVLVGGSTQEEEDLMIAMVYRQLRCQIKSLRLVLVPRHPERVGRLVAQLKELGLTVQRRSKWSRAEVNRESNAEADVLVVDVIGELGAWWGCAHVAYVGGSMGARGGQNMIEPAAYGIPVSFGPQTENFKETVEMLLAANSAQVVENPAELAAFVQWVNESPQAAKSMGQRAQGLVLEGRGAVQNSIDLLNQLMTDNHGQGLLAQRAA